MSPFLFALMFARADLSSLQLMVDAFNKFSKALGLDANLDKSRL